MTSVAFASVLWMHGAALAQDAPAQDAPAQEAEAEVAVEPPQEGVVPAAATDQAVQPDGAAQDTAQGAAQDTLLSEAQLEQLVAPIALYPDSLLANVLIASTYPLEVVQADRWYEKNKELKGEALQEALAQQDWDDSIKDLVAVPDALEMMNKDLDWTQKLGDAVLAQQSDVMNAVQALRLRAKENGQLESNPQQTVTVTQTVVQNGDGASGADEAAAQSGQQTQDVIVIESTDPEKIYVPYYQPSVVYGTWPYPSYQPYYFPPPPGYRFGNALLTGFAWSAGFAIGNAIWGNNINWGRNDININVNRNISGNTINRNNANFQKWEHNSVHRRGVQYNNTEVRNKFENRQGDRTNVGDRRPGGGEGRPGGGNRPGNAGGRPTVGDIEAGLKRPGGGEGRPGGGNLGDRRPGGGEGRPAGGNRPAVGGGNRPAAGGGNRPGGGQANLRDRPAAGKPAANRPAANRPAANKPAANRPAPKPSANRPQSRPSGNAFKQRPGGGARNASSRGRASAGGRSVSRGHAGGHRGGGGGRRR